MYRKSVLLFLSFSALWLFSCSEDAVKPGLNETVLFEKSGLVDSAVVYGCYPYTVRYLVPDTLELSSYSKVRVIFDGFANSDGSSISVLYNTADSTNITVYYVEDQANINKLHRVDFVKPSDMTWLEVRLYINPPVCGENEFKYTRVRDLIIYGITN
jgi:hypothetical protein